jgi:predicted nucleotidyltransferase
VLYSLNREHLLAPSIIEMADIGRELAKRIADRVDGWQVEPVLVAIFGSAASGHMRPDSDIDLLVVRSDRVDPDSASWRSQIVDLERVVSAWTGNDARVLEFSLTEAQRRPKERVLEDAIAHGIAVVGDFSALAPQARRIKGSR